MYVPFSYLVGATLGLKSEHNIEAQVSLDVKMKYICPHRTRSKKTIVLIEPAKKR